MTEKSAFYYPGEARDESQRRADREEALVRLLALSAAEKANFLLDLADQVPRLVLELMREPSRPWLFSGAASTGADSTSEPSARIWRSSGRTQARAMSEQQSGRPHIVETRFECDRLLPGSVEIVKCLSDGTARLVSSWQWQQGPSGAVGVNGCDVEDVLQICRMQLHRWQKHAGQPDDFSTVVLRALDTAILALEGRALDRAERGVVD